VCVCVREREREKESECVCVCVGLIFWVDVFMKVALSSKHVCVFVCV